MGVGSAIRRIKQSGLKNTVEHYSSYLASRMSPNYRQNPLRIRQMGAVGAAGFVLSDYVLVLIDRIIHGIDVLLIGRSDLPRAGLEEFAVRLLAPKLLNAQAVVYAFGVARHIETEEELARRVGCTVYLFDPTPPAVQFMRERAPDPKLVFDPIGVWVKSGPIKFYMDRRETAKNLSVVNMYHTDNYIEAPCYTLQDIMKRKGHTHIDVLKMDIEGSALPVLLDMLEHTSIRPTQIVGALERPHLFFGASFGEISRILRGKARLFSKLNKEGYRILTHHAAEFSAVRN